MRSKDSNHAFTLVEISVVLVIIGLIIGGIALGTTLIRSAEIKNLISQFEQYDQAVVSFRSKYDATPGDMPNATDFFPGATNGNGDGRIFWSLSETQSAWQQLALSGLIPGTYSVTGSTLTSQNAPTGLAGRAVFALYYIDVFQTPGITSIQNPNPMFGNHVEILALGRSLASSIRGIIPAIDALAIDIKMDDGRPATGRVIGAVGGNAGCLSSPVTNYNYMASYAAITNNLCTVTVRLSTL